MKIRNMFFAMAFAASSMTLTACSEKQVEQGVITSEATLATMETAAFQYEQGDFGTPDPAVVAQIKAYDQQAYNAITVVRAKAQAGQAITTTEEVTITSAITALEAYLASKNIITKTTK